jgi:esterase/lipase superfamily enzyme
MTITEVTNMTDFILCARNEDAGKFGIEHGRVSYLKVPDSEQLPLPEHKESNVQAWFNAVLAKATDNRNKIADVVFFVHGYNADSVEALKRQRLIEKELNKRGYNCIVVGFDWPTAGSPVAYLYDRGQASDSAVSLVKGGIIPFAQFNRKDCPVNIHVMAHSMGGFVVREAFRNADKARMNNVPTDWRISQLVLFAADISSDCFKLDSDMIPVFNHCGRLTNYFSGHDEALAVSNLKNIDIDSRVGRVGMSIDTPAHAKALDVDCGPRYITIP